MRIIGTKITIRDLTFKDSKDFYEFGKDPLIGPMAGWKPFPNYDVACRLLSSLILNKETYAITEIDNNKLIGTFSIYNYGIRKYKYVKSLGFSLATPYHNKGYMTEAVNLAIDYVFRKTDCELLEVGCHTDNLASKRVIEKCGFKYDGKLEKYKALYDGRVVDAYFYSMTKEEYERKKLI